MSNLQPLTPSVSGATGAFEVRHQEINCVQRVMALAIAVLVTLLILPLSLYREWVGSVWRVAITGVITSRVSIAASTALQQTTTASALRASVLWTRLEERKGNMVYLEHPDQAPYNFKHRASEENEFWHEIFESDAVIVDATGRSVQQQLKPLYYPETVGEIYQIPGCTAGHEQTIKLIRIEGNKYTYKLNHPSSSNNNKEYVRYHFSDWDESGIVSVEILKNYVLQIEKLSGEEKPRADHEDLWQKVWILCTNGLGPSVVLGAAVILKERIDEGSLLASELDDYLVDLIVDLRKEGSCLVIENEAQLKLLLDYAILQQTTRASALRASVLWARLEERKLEHPDQAPYYSEEEEENEFWHEIFENDAVVVEAIGRSVQAQLKPSYFPEKVGEIYQIPGCIAGHEKTIKLIRIEGNKYIYKLNHPSSSNNKEYVRYHFSDWDESGIVSVEILKNYVLQLEKLLGEEEDLRKKVWFYCTHGVGPGAVLAAAVILKQNIDEGDLSASELDDYLVDVIVEHTKEPSCLFIENEAQLKLLLDYAISLFCAQV